LPSVVGVAPYVHRFAAAAHRIGSGFNQLDHTYAESAVRLRSLPVADAVDEMFSFDAQRFRSVELRRPHVSGAVADAHLMNLRRIIGEADALIVDLELLAGLEIVVNYHLLAAADENLAHFHRSQPADITVRNQARVVEQRDERQVLRRSGKMVDPARGHGDRMLAE